MKKIYLSIILSSIIVMATACGDSNKAGGDATTNGKETVILKFATPQSETHSLTEEVYKPFMERATELTDGQVEFEFYPAEQLGKAADLYELAKDGVADIVFYISSYYPEMMPITSDLILMPGLYSTSYEGTMAYHELSKEIPVLESDFLDNGVRPIFSYDAPAGELWTKGKEIKTPDDLSGLKVRTTGEVLNKTTSALNATPVNITLSEMYEAFDKGVYDAINLNAQSLHDHGLGELVEYGTKGVNFGGSGTGLIINESTFQDLPEDVQKVLLELGDELTESNALRTDEYVESIFEEYENEGVKIHELTDDEKKQWDKDFEKTRTKIIEESDHTELDKVYEDFLEKVKEFK